MPNCFQLIRKTTGEAETFVIIDEEICAHLNVEPDPIEFLAGWYDSIGIRAASGNDWAKIREDLKEYDTLSRIVDFLEEHYTISSWYQRGR